MTLGIVKGSILLPAIWRLAIHLGAAILLWQAIQFLRSAKAVRQLQGAGFRRVWNLAGGILRWSDDVDQSVPKY